MTHKQLQFSLYNKLTNNTQVTSQDETLNVRSRRELGSMPTTRTRAAAAMGDEDVVRRPGADAQEEAAQPPASTRRHARSPHARVSHGGEFPHKDIIVSCSVKETQQ